MSRRLPDVIVTPIYEDIEASTRLFQDIRAELGPDVVIVAVDDGSVRQPVSPGPIAEAGLRGVVLRLKRNVGHQRAIAVGLAYVAEEMPGATCVVMDSDGEDLPATIPDLMEAIGMAEVDVSVAQRRNRVETTRFKLFYLLYKFLFKTMTGRFISFGNFMALKPAAVARLSCMQELGTHVAGTVLVSRLRIAMCPLDRGPRYAGKSKMNFAGLVLHGFRALMIFAEDVLVRAGLLCVAVAVLTVLAIIVTILLKFIGLTTPGWFSVALGILFVVLLQTSALTLITLMLTGVVRGTSPVTAEYRLLVGEVLRTHA
jgi:hypothetical protein